MDKTIKVTILLIIFLIIGSVIFAFVYSNKNTSEIDIDVVLDNETVKLEEISYEILGDDTYHIYDSEGTYIVTVYSYEELQYYIENPDFRLSYNNLDDEEIDNEILDEDNI